MASKTGFLRQTAPYVRDPKPSVQRMMYDVLIALAPITIFTLWRFGMTAVWILLVAVISMAGTEYLYYKVKKEPFTLKNGSILISAIIYTLILPDVTPLWIVAIGGIFGAYFGKVAFGGLGANIFNVAGFARVFVVLSFGSLLTYQVDTIDGVAGATVLSVANQSFEMMAFQDVSIWEMIWGIGEPGSLGEGNMLLILLGGAWLFFRKSFDWRIPVVYLGSFFGLALIAGMINGAGIDYALVQLLSGGVIFGAIFMATDPITAPVTKPGRIYFAFGLAVLTYFIRVFGALPEGVVFAILIMNMFVPAFDYYKWSNSKFTKKSIIGFSIVVVLSIALLVAGVA